MKNSVVLLLVVLLGMPALSAQITRHAFRTSEGLIEVEKMANPEVILLFDDFKSGVVYYPNERLAQMRLNYRLLADEFIVEGRGGRHSSLSTGAAFDSILVNNMVFVHIDGLGYFQKIAQDGVEMFVKHISTYSIEEIRSDSYGQASSSASMQESHVVQINRNTSLGHTGDIRHENSSGNPMNVTVIRRPVAGIFNNGEFIPVTNRRQLLRQFPEHRSELRRFVSSERIDFDNVEDIPRLVAYISSLQ